MRLTVLYDETCPLCVRCRNWMLGQPAYVEINFLACQSDEARRRFGDVPWLGEELVIVSDDGDVWAGPAAFLMCLWALRDWRDWSYTLSGPTLLPLAERFFHLISSRRRRIGALLGPNRCDKRGCRHDAERLEPYR
jgi:predicted DCC family thiol-disulfide oxidoreductase YuxK